MSVDLNESKLYLKEGGSGAFSPKVDLLDEGVKIELEKYLNQLIKDFSIAVSYSSTEQKTRGFFGDKSIYNISIHFGEGTLTAVNNTPNVVGNIPHLGKVVEASFMLEKSSGEQVLGQAGSFRSSEEMDGTVIYEQYRLGISPNGNVEIYVYPSADGETDALLLSGHVLLKYIKAN